MKRKKRKGFTLIEMVAVVAIIGILAAILVPKITGYMNEAKKTKVIDQARKVVQAYESTQMKDKINATTEDENKTIDTLIGNTTFSGFLLPNSGDSAKTVLPNIKTDTVTIAKCRAVANGADFTITNDKLITN